MQDRSQPSLTPVFQLRQNGTLQALGLGGAAPALLDLAVAANEEFFKIPLNPLNAEQARFLQFHPLVQRLRLVAVYFRLAQHGESDAIVDLAELLDRVIVARVLRVELVAGHAEDDEGVAVRGGDGLVEFL